MRKGLSLFLSIAIILSIVAPLAYTYFSVPSQQGLKIGKVASAYTDPTSFTVEYFYDTIFFIILNPESFTGVNITGIFVNTYSNGWQEMSNSLEICLDGSYQPVTFPFVIFPNDANTYYAPFYGGYPAVAIKVTNPSYFGKELAVVTSNGNTILVYPILNFPGGELHNKLLFEGLNAAGSSPYTNTPYPYYTSSLFPQLTTITLISSTYSSGLVITNGSYYNGKSFTEEILGSFTSDYPSPADGYAIGMFLTPGEDFFSYQNWSVPFYVDVPSFTPPAFKSSSEMNFPLLGTKGPFAPFQGILMLPYSTTPYLVVQWDPYWGNKGQFNVLIVDYGSPSSPPIIISYIEKGYGDISNLRPYDLILFKVTYFSNGTLEAEVIDLDSGEVESLLLNLQGFNPEPGVYWTYVNSPSDVYYENWNLLYWNFTTVNNSASTTSTISTTTSTTTSTSTYSTTTTTITSTTTTITSTTTTITSSVIYTMPSSSGISNFMSDLSSLFNNPLFYMMLMIVILLIAILVVLMTRR
ncbi:MAG: hypothetical protein TQ35_0009305 [Candidatus Aramenus sulfurataquae]|jgi:hypothetical protein|uniref:Uncharacterized protein n=2 Tax=Candidatus Aramenus sulfurataquae TaxID=1326980 RepID=A0A0F2LRD9_9CREN|nr:hypothetical protein [Candidatus Aramenus sulfurataquae]